jgi:hypothetical protein
MIPPPPQQQKIHLIPISGMYPGPTITLCRPNHENEHCSITLDLIGEPPSILPLTVPLLENPHLTCAEIDGCCHRFNAMALIAHFASNAMTCPMCRAGLSDIRMDTQASFPGEPWIPVIGSLFPRHSPSHSSRIIPITSEDVSIFTVILLYRDLQDLPSHIIECQLDHTHEGTYSMRRAFSLQVLDAIRDLQIQSISASIYAAPNPAWLTGRIQLATMERTWLSTRRHDYVAPSNPNNNDTTTTTNNNNTTTTNNNNTTTTNNNNTTTNNNNNITNNNNNNNNNNDFVYNSMINNTPMGSLLMTISSSEEEDEGEFEDILDDNFSFIFTPANMSLIRMSAG